MKRLVVLVAAAALLATQSSAVRGVRRHRLLGHGRSELAAEARSPSRAAVARDRPGAPARTDAARRRGAGAQDQEGNGPSDGVRGARDRDGRFLSGSGRLPVRGPLELLRLRRVRAALRQRPHVQGRHDRSGPGRTMSHWRISMKKLVLVLAVGLVAAFVPSAGAGGWATVGLSSLPPSGLEAGQDWPVDITVLQHGETPLTGVQPSITVRNLETGATAGRFAGEADRQARRLPAGRPLPGRRNLVVRGLRRLHRVRQRPAAHVQARRDRRRRLGLVLPDAARRRRRRLAVLLIGIAILLLRRPRTAPEPAAAGR